MPELKCNVEEHRHSSDNGSEESQGSDESSLLSQLDKQKGVACQDMDEEKEISFSVDDINSL